MSKSVATLLLMLEESEKRRKRCEALAAAIRSLEVRAKSSTGLELEKIEAAIQQGKKLLEDA